MSKQKPSQEELMWKQVSGDLFPKIQELKKIVKSYSYKNLEESKITDEKLCQYFITELSKAKRLVFSISDLCFSLQIGQEVISKTDVMRDEIDIFSDEIKIRHCEWRGMFPEILEKIVKYDLEILIGLKTLLKDLENVVKNIIAQKKPYPDKFWQQVNKSFAKIRKRVRDLAIKFKERETLCNIHPITLERTFNKIKQEIEWKV